MIFPQQTRRGTSRLAPSDGRRHPSQASASWDSELAELGPTAPPARRGTPSESSIRAAGTCGTWSGDGSVGPHGHSTRVECPPRVYELPRTVETDGRLPSESRAADFHPSQVSASRVRPTAPRRTTASPARRREPARGTGASFQPTPHHAPPALAQPPGPRTGAGLDVTDSEFWRAGRGTCRRSCRSNARAPEWPPRPPFPPLCRSPRASGWASGS